MWRYRHPGFALLLLRELQKQQHGSLHCDTLLQTEGVTVPAHSCVLSALSPVFSRALANSPSLPMGQSKLVKLNAVGANALLKLVGFIYSGEMMGEGLGEQEEVIDVAHKLGFGDLIDGQKKQVNRHQDKAVRWREIGLQTEGGRKNPSMLVLTKGRNFTHAGTQTDSPEADMAGACRVSGPELSMARPPALASVSCKSSNTSPLAGVDLLEDTATSPSSLSETLDPARFKCSQQTEKMSDGKPKKIDHVNKSPKQIKLLNVKGTESELLNSGILARTKRIGGKDFRRLIDKLGFQNSTVFEQSGHTQLSLKIKFKRRSRGALWEIVSIHEESRAGESSVCESTASERCHGDQGMLHSDCENQRTCLGFRVAPSEALACQSLGTVTLTPPSDLNTSSPVRDPSEKPHLPTHDSILLSSPLQMQPTSQGLPQAEESDEHIARLLEDMVMMGINILPSESTNGNGMHQLNQLSSHLDSKMERCEAAQTNNLCVDGESIGVRGPGAGNITSGQQAAGSKYPALKCPTRCRTVDLQNVAPVASYPASFMSPCVTPQKDLPVCTESLGLPHQNVGQLNVLDKLFWTADNTVQSMKHGNVHTSNMTTSNTAQHSLDRVNTTIETNKGMASSTAVKDPFCITHQALFNQTEASKSDDGANFNEMRLPKCLSPLACETEECGNLRPLEMSSLRSVSPVDLQPLLFSSPQPKGLPGIINQENPSCARPYLNSRASLSSSGPVLRSRSCSLRRKKNYIEEATKSRLGRLTMQSHSLENWTSVTSEDDKTDRPADKASNVKRISPKRCSVDAVTNERDGKRAKMAACGSNEVDVQVVMLMKPCSVNEGTVPGIEATQQLSNMCSKKIHWLRSGKTVKRVSTDLTSLENQSHCKTANPLKCGNQSEPREGMNEKETALVAKCGRGRPPKKAKCAAGFVQKLSKIRKSNNSCTGFDYSSSADHCNLQFAQRSKIAESVQNEGHILVKDNKQVKHTHGRPSKKGKRALDLVSKMQTVDGLSEGFVGHHDLHKAKCKVSNGCGSSTAQEPELSNASHEDISTDANTQTSKQLGRYANRAKRPSIVDHVFHQTIYSKGTDAKFFLPVGLRAKISFQDTENSETTERKCCTNPPPSNFTKKFGDFREQGLLKRGTLVMGVIGQEKEADGESIVERRVDEVSKAGRGVDVDGKAEKVIDKSKNKKADSENRAVGGKELQSSYKSKHGCLIGNCETDTGRMQDDDTDVNINSIHPYLPSHNVNVNAQLGSDLYSVPFVTAFNNACEVENDSQSESCSIIEHSFGSEDKTHTVMSVGKSKTLDAGKDFKHDQVSESVCEMLTSSCNESMEVASDMTGDFHHADSVNAQIGKPNVWNKEKVKERTEKGAISEVEMTKNGEQHGAAVSDVDMEVVEEIAQVTTGHGNEAANTGWKDGETGMDGSRSSVMITDAEASTEEEFRGQQFLSTKAEGISSDEALTRTPASVSKEGVFVQRLEEPEQTDPNSSVVNTTGSSAVNLETTENWDCEENEEVVVDDVWGSPSVLPHLSTGQPITILDEDTQEEEEEVDVTGEETD